MFRVHLRSPKEGKENVKPMGAKAAGAAEAGVPSMSDILKGLGAVKLRPVAARPAALRPVPTDPGAFLEEALRRKFAAANAEDSPASVANNDSSWADSSPESSPYKVPPAPPLLSFRSVPGFLQVKSTPRRRSSLAPFGQNGANIA